MPMGPYLSLIRSTPNNLGEMPPLNLEDALLGEISCSSMEWELLCMIMCRFAKGNVNS
jgi:hypothetical protein